MRSFLKALAIGFAAVVAFVAPLPNTPATAEQFVVLNPNETGISNAVTAVDVSDVGIIVRYVGPTPTGATTIEVAADGNLIFVRNAAADTSLECPVAGALGGIIDVSDAACNTVAEVVDTINSSADWAAAAVSSLRTDDSDLAGVGLFVTRAATRASGVEGVPLFIDGAAADYMNLTLASRAGVADARDYGFGAASGGAGSGSSSTTLAVRPSQPKDPFEGMTSRLQLIRTTVTHGGAGTVTIRGVTRKYFNKGSLPAGAATASPSYEETTRTVWAQAGSATTVEQVLDFTNIGGLAFNLGERPIVRRADTAQTAFVGNAAGITFKKQ